MNRSRTGFNERLRQLDRRRQLAYMATLTQRLLPNYALYSQASGHGDAGALRGILDLVWETLLVSEARIDFARQAEKLALLEPPGDDDSFGARRAVETVMALSAILDALQSEVPDAPLDVSRVSGDGVRAFIEMTEGREEDDAEQTESRIRSHELMKDERDFQDTVLEMVEDELDRDTLKALRRLGRNEGVSNLGLSLE
ncbi:YjaG family protein [Halomonas shantousis]